MIEVNVTICFSVCFGEQQLSKSTQFSLQVLTFKVPWSKPSIFWQICARSGRTVRNQHLRSVIVLLPFLYFFTFQLKKNFTLSRIQKNLVSRSLNLHLPLDFFFLPLFTLYKKWLLLNLVCLQSRPRFYPTLVGFPPAYCFTYIYSFVSFFFLRFFKLIFFVFSHFVDVVSVNCYVNVCVFVSVTLAINIRSVAFVFRYRIFSLFCFVKVYSLFTTGFGSILTLGFHLDLKSFEREKLCDWISSN